MTITDLPIEILLIIIDYAFEENERFFCSAFASVNRSFSSSLLRKARRIALKTDDEKWKSNEKRAKLLGMIDDPYHQLLFGIKGNDNDFMNATSISSMLSEVGSLYWLADFSGPDSGLAISILLAKLIRFKIKNLSLWDVFDVESFDVIPSLQFLLLRNSNNLKIETLNLSAYPLLRSLRLYDCSSVEDVSCLDGIYDLELHSCQNITDISPLNNNYRVIITSRDSIASYSKFFRCTRFLQIEENRQDVIVSLDGCFHLTSLSLSSTKGITDIDVSFLMVLSVRYDTKLTVLPSNRLQKVCIISCWNFTRLDNMDHIRSIHLEDLNNITTLTGLGPKNQIIKLERMKLLEDISSLKESQTMKIKDCPLLHTSNRISYLTSVKELELCKGYYLSTSQFVRSLTQLESLINLKVLKLSIYDKRTYESLQFHILQTFKNLEKIVLRGSWLSMMKEDDILEIFIVTIRNKSGDEIILLRKRVIPRC